MCALQTFLQPGNPKFSTFCHVKNVSPSGVNKFFFHLVVFPAAEESSVSAPLSGEPTFSNTFPTALEVAAVKEVQKPVWASGAGGQTGVTLSDALQS